MKITLKKLDKWYACPNGRAWFSSQDETDARKLVEKLIAENKRSWPNWLVTRCLSRKNKIRYAVYAAEQVLPIYEKKYPDDKRPRRAIAAARKVLEADTAENRAAAASAARSSSTANTAAAFAANAARFLCAAAAADAAANAAVEAAADAAANAAVEAADNNGKEMLIKILRYGMEMI